MVAGVGATTSPHDDMVDAHIANRSSVAAGSQRPLSLGAAAATAAAAAAGALRLSPRPVAGQHTKEHERSSSSGSSSSNGAVRLVRSGGDNGNTKRAALHLAAQRGEVDAVSELLDKGLDAASLDPSGKSPLLLAIKGGHLPVVSLLLEHGAADPSRLPAKGPSGMYSLVKAAVSKDHVEILEALVEQGRADVCAADAQKTTALHHAAMLGKTEAIEVLLDSGAEVNSADVDGCTALHWASMEGHSETLIALLGNGADIDAVDNAGRTALHRCCFVDDTHATEAAELLLLWGADDGVVDADGHNAEHYLRLQQERDTGHSSEAAKQRAQKSLLKLLRASPAERAWCRHGLVILCKTRLGHVETATVLDRVVTLEEEELFEESWGMDTDENDDDDDGTSNGPAKREEGGGGRDLSAVQHPQPHGKGLRMMKTKTKKDRRGSKDKEGPPPAALRRDPQSWIKARPQDEDGSLRKPRHDGQAAQASWTKPQEEEDEEGEEEEKDQTDVESGGGDDPSQEDLVQQVSQVWIKPRQKEGEEAGDNHETENNGAGASGDEPNRDSRRDLRDLLAQRLRDSPTGAAAEKGKHDRRRVHGQSKSCKMLRSVNKPAQQERAAKSCKGLQSWIKPSPQEEEDDDISWAKRHHHKHGSQIWIRPQQQAKQEQEEERAAAEVPQSDRGKRPSQRWGYSSHAIGGDERASPDDFSRCYVLGEKLGEGEFSESFAATRRREDHHPQQQFSSSIIAKRVARQGSPDESECGLVQEVRVLRVLAHPNVVAVLNVFDDSRDYLYAVFERPTGGTVLDLIVRKARYRENDARRICRILVQCMQHCHDLGVVHRDIHPENLLLSPRGDDEPIIKLAGFGFARTLPGWEEEFGGHGGGGMGGGLLLSESYVTAEYAAPEVLMFLRHGTGVDMWALGVVFYILLGGYHPFYDQRQPRLLRRVKDGSFAFHDSLWGDVSDLAKDFVRGLLVVDASKRMTAKQALEHPWMLVSSKDLAKNDLANNQEQLHVYNAVSKLRAAIRLRARSKR